MPYSNSVLQDLVEAPPPPPPPPGWGGGGGCVNCNKQERSPRSRHEVARGWDREGVGEGVPLRRWKENGNQEMLR